MERFVIHTTSIWKSICWFLIAILVVISSSFSQETNADISGLIRSPEGEALEGASIVIVHLPTMNTYKTRSNSRGYFLVNLKPGGPYQLSISFTGFRSTVIGELYANLNSGSFYSSAGSKEHSLFIMQRVFKDLPGIAVTRKSESRSIGLETSVSAALIKDMPSISRNFQDYARLTPQARVNGDGGLSFAGQNNKFNAFFIDGASGLDLLGVSASGISGGQTSSPPISVDALEEVKILISPFDVQYGNITGASVNAVTRSGSNQFKSSAWYYFRNEDMAGRSPQEDTTAHSRSKLSTFFNNTLGAWASGAVIKDKLFYFSSIEWQKEDLPQPFNINEYKGASSKQQFDALRDTVLARYGYDPGRYDLTNNDLRAVRFITKIDWNHSFRHKFSFTYRTNSAERQASNQSNGSTQVRFQNNSYKVFTNTRSATLEWRSFLNSRLSNRFLLSYNSQEDDRRIIGKPFPVVNISDGPGTIVLGSNGSAQLSLFKGQELNLLDIFKVVQGRHVFTFGTDMNFSWLNDLILGSYFGSYSYLKLDDFLSNSYAFRYRRSFLDDEKPIQDESKTAGAKFMTSRLGFFVQDELKFSPNVKLRYGLRLDGNSWNTSYPADQYFNTVALPAISAYYDLQGARSGLVPQVHWQFQPRIELTAKLPDENVILKFGAGIFTGHILNIWASDIYNYRTVSLDVSPSSIKLPFNPDVNSQPGYQSLGLDPAKSKGSVTIASSHLRYPTIWRMSSSLSKTIGKGWNTSLEFLLTRDIHEMRYTNVNILPPTMKSAGAGSRVVYSAGNRPPTVPMNGENPYNTVILMANNEDHKGYSYSISAVINSPSTERSNFITSYTFGHSKAVYEPTGGSGPNGEQWRTLETINGRNFASRSISDFSPAHRVYLYYMRRFIYARGRTSTSISLFYQGQSGQTYSYVYDGSIVNDIAQIERYDLLYVPTRKELEAMVFLPVINGRRGSYSPEQQKAMFEAYIEADPYLRSIRGSFSQRNKARQPFTHTVDIRLQQEFLFKAGKNKVRAAVILDVFNFMNMLNHDWGRTYVLPLDRYPLIKFVRFASSNDLTPQYQFDPEGGKPWSVETSSAPGNSARWISQLGFRFNF